MPKRILIVVFTFLFIYTLFTLAVVFWCDDEVGAAEGMSIDLNSELVRNLNVLYDPNFYLNTESYCLSFNFPDSNSIEDISGLLRENLNILNPTADIIVYLGDEKYTASFEDFFEWITKKEQN